MLYVFHVDTGRMIKFDMNVALGSVQNLKETIQRTHCLPATNIVLLVSGGDMLAPGKLVCSYSAGTDTNPIYMFSTLDVKPQPCPSTESSNLDTELANQVKRCVSLPANYRTVVIRAQLALQMYESARAEETVCETLVHEQHLQQQGWSAVIANMEDLTEEFRQRFEDFSHSFDDHLSKRDQHLELLHNFNDDLMNLSKIPILPVLLQNADQEFHGFDEYLDNDEVFSRSQQNESMIAQTIDGSDTDTGIVSSSSGSGGVEQKRPRLSKENTPDTMSLGVGVSGGGGSNSSCIDGIDNITKSDEIDAYKGGLNTISRNLTLLQWISAKENHHALKTMAEECNQGLGTFTQEKYDKLKVEVLNTISMAQQEDVKEIKGLESRLCGLEKMMHDLKKFVQDQKELSSAFQLNQNRASDLGDATIFPDLCASHQSQLSHMLNYHSKIRDYRRRVSRAKDELGINLNQRLKYIVHIENTMSNLDNNLLFYHRCLKRVERHINIIQQIHQTPRIYVAAITEVVRRRIFSGEFVRWASTLAFDFDGIHNDEVQRRKEFNVNFEGHFLNALFPGMRDMPPAFANENPLVFDASLPNITKNDFDELTNFLPAITKNIQLPDMGTVIEFFISRSGNKSSDEKMITSANQKSQSIGASVEGTISIRPIDLHSHLKDGFESETDTEEFEKLGRSTNDQKDELTSVSPPLTYSVSTSTTNVNKAETACACIGTEPIETKTVETLTETEVHAKIWAPLKLSASPPKKPPRLTKTFNLGNHHTVHTITSSMTSMPETTTISTTNTSATATIFPTLPVILEKEIQICANRKSAVHSTPMTIPYPLSDIYNNLGHQHSAYLTAIRRPNFDDCGKLLSPTLSPPCRNYNSPGGYSGGTTTATNHQIDSEFINSEFYIDESLPSSLNDDDEDCCNDYDIQITNKQLALNASRYCDWKRCDKGQISHSNKRRKLNQKNCNEINTDEDDDDDDNDDDGDDDDNDDKLPFSTAVNCKGSMETVFGLLQENLGSRQIEIEHLKSLLKKMSHVSYQCLELLKNKLQTLKTSHETNKHDIQIQLNSLSETWSRVQNDFESRERYSIEQLQSSYENKLTELKNNLFRNENILQILRCERNKMESSQKESLLNLQIKCNELEELILKYRENILKLEEKINASELEKKRAVTETRDKLLHEHKTELESLRCRFKLMTSMERSPSDSSLEKIEKLDMIEIASHESILMQTREDFNNEKEEAVREALRNEKLKWETCFANSLTPSNAKAMAANIELLQKMVEEKDKQLDNMRDRDLVLSKENCQLKMKIEALTNEEESDKGWLKEKIEYLNRDKNRLEQELSTEKVRRIEMETSVTTLKSSTIEAAGTRSKPGRISTDTCNNSDIVFVVWNIRHRQFIVVQETPTLYFVHGDSLIPLNLKLPIPGDTEIPVPFYTLARVCSKEYCQARKEENRYKVSKGTKFYRIKLEPIIELKWHNRRERLESCSGLTRLTTMQHLTDSFAQTENPATTAIVIRQRDMVDSAINLKERTVSMTSITEEDDDPIALLCDRNRYISVSEEEERAVTDQPSSLSTDYETGGIPANISPSISSLLDDCTASGDTISNMDVNLSVEFNTHNDDSDEYRSLEGKEDIEFPVLSNTTASTTSSTIQTISPTLSYDI